MVPVLVQVQAGTLIVESRVLPVRVRVQALLVDMPRRPNRVIHRVVLLRLCLALDLDLDLARNQDKDLALALVLVPARVLLPITVPQHPRPPTITPTDLSL